MSLRVAFPHAAGANLAAFVRQADGPLYYDPVAGTWSATVALTALAAEGSVTPTNQLYTATLLTPAADFPDGEYFVGVQDTDSGDLVGWSVAALHGGSDAYVEPAGAAAVEAIQGAGFDPAEHSLAALHAALAAVAADVQTLLAGGSGGGSWPPGLDSWSGLFATDADLATAIPPEDWSRLTPDSQMVARGTDGAIVAEGHVLTSASNPDFEVRGVIPGMVARVHNEDLLTHDLLLIAAVAGGDLTLRRVGLGAGEGASPAGAAGVAGLRFEVQTFRPQLAAASSWVADLTGLTTADTTYTDRLRAATVAKVAYDAYSAVAEVVPSNTYGGGRYELRARKFKADLLAELALLFAVLGRSARAAIEAQVASGDGTVGRYETPSDWIVPEGW